MLKFLKQILDIVYPNILRYFGEIKIGKDKRQKKY